MLPFAAIFSDFLPNHGDCAENETKEAKTGGHFIVSDKEIYYFAEEQNANSHTQNKGKQETAVFIYLLKKITQGVEGFFVQTEND